MKSSNRRKTISSSDLESFLCDIDDDSTAKKSGAVDENAGVQIKPKQIAAPIDITIAETMDIAHAVRLFCRVRILYIFS